MKSTTLSKVAAAALCVPLAIGLAGPASADSATDEQFLQALKAKGIKMSDGKALSLAHSTCTGLQQGGTVDAALKHVKQGSGLNATDATAFAGYAVYSYCRQYMPKSSH